MEKASKRERMAWYFYDFGNSAYAAVVILAVFSAYYKGTVVGGAEGSRMWGLAIGIAMLMVAIISPLLGTIADYAGSKKKFLFFLTAQAVLFTASLYFVQEGDAILGMVLLVLAESGYRGAQVFYNSLLPEIASPEEISKVSGNGWAIGSLGGILCLLLILPMIVIVGGTLVVRLSLVFTAVFFAASTLPLFLWLKERAEPKPLPEGETYLTLGFKRLFETFRAIRNFKEFLRFILAFLIYNDGIIMALNFAAILGAVLFGMEQQELIIFHDHRPGYQCDRRLCVRYGGGSLWRQTITLPVAVDDDRCNRLDVFQQFQSCVLRDWSTGRIGINRCAVGKPHYGKLACTGGEEW